MGINDRHHKNKDKNSKKLPQTPRNQIAHSDDDLELAKELSDRYELKAKPGFPPTEVERKK